MLVQYRASMAHTEALTLKRHLGFRYRVLKSGSVMIFRGDRPLVTLASDDAARFLEDAAMDDQLAMARFTGNYRHGNERHARKPPNLRDG
jgi:hypothetical protein